MTLRIAAAAAAVAALALATGASAAEPPRDPLAADALMADVSGYVDHGPVEHLTGGAADVSTQAWMLDGLRATGMKTGVDGYRFFQFRVRAARLVVDGKQVDAIAPYLYSGVTEGGPVDAPLVDGGTGTGADMNGKDVKGKLVVIDVAYTAGNAVAPTLSNAFKTVQDAGAAGLIAVTEGPQDLPVNADVDSRAGVHHLPTVFVGKKSGEAVIAAAQAGKQGSLLLDADVGHACATNSWGMLPGRDPSRYIVIATPTGAFVPSASERGSGVAALLGLARHYAAMPAADRPVSLVFAVLSGHEIGYLGLPTLMQTHRQWFSYADAYVHLGASLGAVEQTEGPDGSVQRSDQGAKERLLYISENPLLQAGTTPAFAPAKVGSSAPGAVDPGEQGYAYHEGIPIIASSGSSYWFHTSGDTLQAVGPDVLESMVAGFQGSIDYAAGLPPGDLRAANGAAAQLGAAREPNPTPAADTPGAPAEVAVPDDRCAGAATGSAPGSGGGSAPGSGGGSSTPGAGGSSTPGAGGQGGGSAGNTPSPCVDVTPPRSAVSRRHSRLSRRRVVVSGRSKDPGCAGALPFLSRRGKVSRVAISIARRGRHGRCRALRRNGRLARPRACRRRVWIAARGTTHWVLRRHARLRPGRYVIRARATDLHGQAERKARRGNPIKLRVRAG